VSISFNACLCPLSRSLLSILVLGSGSLSYLSAQPKPVDLESRESALSDRRVEMPVNAVRINNRWAEKRFPQPAWAPPHSRLDAKPQARIGGGEAREPERIEMPRYRAPDLLEMQKRPVRQEPRKLDREARKPRDEPRHSFNDVPVFRLAPERPPFEVMVDDLSLADINRFTFQKNHEREPGIPVKPAGGGEASAGK